MVIYGRVPEENVIGAGEAERLPMAFLGREDVIMRLMLEARWLQEGTELCAEEFNPKSEDKACNMEGARPSGRFNVRRAKAG